MPDIFTVIQKWWKKILFVVILCVITAGIIVFLKPKQYLSVATAVPASSYATDKSAIFNENIQALYSSLGEPNDLDRVLGTAALDTIYLAIASEMDLSSHYGIKKEGEEKLVRTAKAFKKQVKVVKSEYGELKVKVWDKDKQIAATLANSVMNKLQQVHQDLRSMSNQMVLAGLIKGRNKLQTDSSGKGLNSADQQIVQYDKLIGEYQLMVDSKPPALILTEKARPSLHPAKPRRKMILLGTALLSLIFSVLAAYMIERAKTASS